MAILNPSGDMETITLQFPSTISAASVNITGDTVMQDSSDDLEPETSHGIEIYYGYWNTGIQSRKMSFSFRPEAPTHRPTKYRLFKNDVH